MAPSRPQPPSPESSVQTAHNLALLQEYTHTLDSLPLDLSRNYGDLRELDAVLSSSMSILTDRVVQLTELIESKAAPKEQRLWLLAEIADEARKLKPGADDKIRVASQSADAVHAHKAHMSTLLDHMPDQEFGKMAGMLDRKTVYPHVSQRTFVSSNLAGDGTRRARRGGANNTLIATNAAEATPAKRKRAAGRDDDLEMVTKSPRKERGVDSHRPRANGRAKKTERAASPAESLLSVASHIPNGAAVHTHLAVSTSRQTAVGVGGRAPSTTASAVRRVKTHAAADANHLAVDRSELLNAPPSSSAAHPSLPLPYANGGPRGELNGSRGVSSGVSEWAHGQLEGPGMPVARNITPAGTILDGNGSAAEVDGDFDPEDTKLYCYCQRVSFGNMIACEDPRCEREWFHLACVGLTSAPAGDWMCDTCLARRAKQRPGRGGKRRAGGGRGAGRNTSA